MKNKKIREVKESLPILKKIQQETEYIEVFMDEKQCEIYRDGIKENVKRNEIRLNNHSDRIDKLEQYRSGTEQQIKNLVDQVSSLVTTMRWFIGLLVGSFVSFFFYAVQHGLFK